MSLRGFKRVEDLMPFLLMLLAKFPIIKTLDPMLPPDWSRILQHCFPNGVLCQRETSIWVFGSPLCPLSSLHYMDHPRIRRGAEKRLCRRKSITTPTQVIITNY